MQGNQTPPGPTPALRKAKSLGLPRYLAQVPAKVFV